MELVGREAIAILCVTIALQYFCQTSITMLWSILAGNSSWLDTGIVLRGGSTKVWRIDKSIADLDCWMIVGMLEY